MHNIRFVIGNIPGPRIHHPSIRFVDMATLMMTKHPHVPMPTTNALLPASIKVEGHSDDGAEDDDRQLAVPKPTTNAMLWPHTTPSSTTEVVEFAGMYTNRRGNRRLHFRGYTYGVHQMWSTTCSWRCVHAAMRNAQCRARATSFIENDQHLVRIDRRQHNHPEPRQTVPDGPCEGLLQVIECR